MSWAIAAYDHAEVHYNILSAVPDARILRLSPFDDRIYAVFCETFPNFDVDRFTEDDIKSGDQKEASFLYIKFLPVIRTCISCPAIYIWFRPY